MAVVHMWKAELEVADDEAPSPLVPEEPKASAG
jgi:hypothetical protein